MEESDDCALEFRATWSGDCVRAEGLPDDALADVGGNEERNSRSQAISLLKQLIQTDDNDSSKEKLQQDTVVDGG